jgi:tRNA A-37 threonylcarbamoyl transferase component Bud32
MSLRSDRVIKLFDSLGGETPISVRERARQLSGTFREARAALPLAPGDVAGNYEVVEALGSGGQAVVYRAKHLQIGRHVALKVPRREVGDRLLREAQLAARLEHPAIARVEDIQLGGEVPFMVLELCERGSLEDLLDAHPNGLPLDHVWTITTAVLNALAFAHEEGVVHRDVKPANILFDKNGNAKVADFGIGTLSAQDGLSVSVELSQLSLIAGTPLYVAPEQENPQLRVGGKLDGRADLFSFGKVLFQMLTGASPRTIRPPSRLRKGLDPAWDDFVFELVAERPEDRFPSAERALAAMPGNGPARTVAPAATPVVVVAPRPAAPVAAPAPSYSQRDAQTVCRVFAAIYFLGLWYTTASAFVGGSSSLPAVPAFGFAFAAAFSLSLARRAARARHASIFDAFRGCLGGGIALVGTGFLVPHAYMKGGDMGLEATLFGTIPLQALGLTLAWLGWVGLAPADEAVPTKRERELEAGALTACTLLVGLLMAYIFLGRSLGTLSDRGYGDFAAEIGLVPLSVIATWLTGRAWNALRAETRREGTHTVVVTGPLAPGTVTGFVCAVLVLPFALVPELFHFSFEVRVMMDALAASFEISALILGAYARLTIALTRRPLAGKWLANAAIIIALLNILAILLAASQRS